MNYIELNINTTSPVQSDILIAELADFPFESFDADGLNLKAYIPKEELALCKSMVDKVLKAHQLTSFVYVELPDCNWNEEWERNFDPVNIADKLYIRAPFHPSKSNEYDMELVIMPRMAFGTGHHQTTQLMCQEILTLNCSGKRVLDMGCGTGVLSILTAKMGATEIDAIDNDRWACDNCVDNIEDNGVNDKIKVFEGSIEKVVKNHYDMILANINLNVILCHIPEYVKMLTMGGVMILSGFLRDDVHSIKLMALSLDLEVVSEEYSGDWAVVKCRKTNFNS